VPENWEVKRLDFLATVKARLGWKALKADEYVDEGYIFLATPNIKGEGEIDFRNVNYITRERYLESPEIMIQVGDVLLAKDGSTLGITNVVRQLPASATVNSSIAVLRSTTKIDSEYLFRWLSSSFMQANIDSLKGGQGVPHLFQSDIKKFPVLLPPLLEQRAIADFLDAKTAVLDNLTAKKRDLLERLREHRTALISRAVTKGLPEAEAKAAGVEVVSRLKDSGVEWLGEVPEHWEVKALKWAVMFQRGHDLPADAREEGKVPLVTSSGISATHSVAVAKAPGIVTGRYGTIGQFYLVEENYFPLNTTLYSVITYGNSVKFLIYLLEHLSPLFTLHSVKSAVPGVDRNDIHTILVSLPPLLEQRAIADYLDRETKRIDHIIARVEAALEKLTEYRTALITAAVTGKIDVREGVAV
jgi:type I restriction enzyme, S subunit